MDTRSRSQRSLKVNATVDNICRGKSQRGGDAHACLAIRTAQETRPDAGVIQTLTTQHWNGCKGRGVNIMALFLEQMARNARSP